MTVLDPAWPAYTVREARGRLADAYGGGERADGTVVPPRLAVVTEGAAAALSAALTLVPAAPEATVTADWASDYSTGEVVIDFGGYALDDVNVTVQQTRHMTANVFESAEARDRRSVGWFLGAPRFGHQVPGSRLSVFLAASQIKETVELHVSGHDLQGGERPERRAPSGVLPPGDA